MQKKCSLFRKQYYLVNSRGRRVSKKYYDINLEVLKNVIIAECKDIRTMSRKYFVYSAQSEKKLEYGEIKLYQVLSNGMFALQTKENNWFVCEENGFIIKTDVGMIRKCKNADLYIIYVVNEQKYYFVDYKFNYVFGPAMDITDFDEFGYSVVKHAEDTVEVISKEFNSILLPYNCTEITPLSKDFFKIKKKGKIGVIDKNGKCIIAPRYHDIFMRSNNHFELIYSGQHGLADKDGRLVFECMFPEIMETPDKFFVKTFSRSEANKVVQLPKNKGEK